MKKEIEVTKVGHDVNGNPRRVVHFLNVVNEADEQRAKELQDSCRPFQFSTSHLYEIAVKKANKLGGRRYHTKNYGGGIVFQSYSDQEVQDICARLQSM